MNNENSKNDNMNPKYYSETDPDDCGDNPSLYDTLYCYVESRDKIVFRPFGWRCDPHIITVITGDQNVSLNTFIGELTAACKATCAPEPAEAIEDLIELYSFLCDPASQARIDKDIARESYHLPKPGKFCRSTTDNGIEIRAGKFRHRVGPKSLTGHQGDLGFLLEEMRHKPWFTDEVKLDLCEFFAARGVEEYMRKL
jgi:hypothetical protein